MSASVLAEILGVDQRTIRKYATAGLVIRSREHKGLYRFEGSVHRVIQGLKNQIVHRHIFGGPDFGRNV